MSSDNVEPVLGTQCCCGRIKECDEPVIMNDYCHEPLGPEGNFCGPFSHHQIRDLHKHCDKLEKALKWYHSRIVDMSNPKASAMYIEAVFTELLLDGGTRGNFALPKDEESSSE